MSNNEVNEALERFAWGDRQQALGDLLPGSDQYFDWQLRDELAGNGASKRAGDLLAEWERSNPYMYVFQSLVKCLSVVSACVLGGGGA
jgi:hypothetical protein